MLVLDSMKYYTQTSLNFTIDSCVQSSCNESNIIPSITKTHSDPHQVPPLSKSKTNMKKVQFHSGNKQFKPLIQQKNALRSSNSNAVKIPTNINKRLQLLINITWVGMVEQQAEQIWGNMCGILCQISFPVISWPLVVTLLSIFKTAS